MSCLRSNCGTITAFSPYKWPEKSTTSYAKLDFESDRENL